MTKGNLPGLPGLPALFSRHTPPRNSFAEAIPPLIVHRARVERSNRTGKTGKVTAM